MKGLRRFALGVLVGGVIVGLVGGYMAIWFGLTSGGVADHLMQTGVLTAVVGGTGFILILTMDE